MRWSHLNGKNENILEHICVIRVHSVFHGIRLSQITPLLLVRENREGTKINNPPAVYASGLFVFIVLVDSPIFIAHSFQKRWATPEKMTGNVFKKHGQCFSKPSATFFETMGNEK